MTDPHRPEAGIADALSQLSQETRVLVRQELDSARDELWTKAAAAAPAVGLLGAAGILGFAAAASAYRFTLRVLERATTPSLAALIATAGFGAGALAALRAGRQRLATAELPVPTATAAETAASVAEAVHRAS